MSALSLLVDGLVGFIVFSALGSVCTFCAIAIRSENFGGFAAGLDLDLGLVPATGAPLVGGASLAGAGRMRGAFAFFSAISLSLRIFAMNSRLLTGKAVCLLPVWDLCSPLSSGL